MLSLNLFLIFGKVNCCGIYLFKLLHRLYHCLEEEFSCPLCFLVVQLSVSESHTDYWVLFKGWTFIYPLSWKISQNLCFISLKTGYSQLQTRYISSFTMSTFFDCEKYISKELSELGWVECFFHWGILWHYVKVKRPEPTGHCYQSSVKWQMLNRQWLLLDQTFSCNGRSPSWALAIQIFWSQHSSLLFSHFHRVFQDIS